MREKERKGAGERESPRPRRPPPPCVGPASPVDDGGCDRAARPSGSDRAARPDTEGGTSTSLPVLARRLHESCQLLRHAYPRSHAGGLTRDRSCRHVEVRQSLFWRWGLTSGTTL
jgi:hypothetical protein